MRVISQYPGYKFQARPQRQRALGDGGVEVTQEPVYCQFLAVNEGAMIYENEMAQAVQHFDFRGNTQHIDEATPSDPMLRLSVYDTEQDAALLPEDKEFVEERLRQLCEEAPSEALLVTSTPMSAPFPKFDTYEGDPDTLVTRLVEDGHDLEGVLYYETTFGQKRPEIVQALENGIEALKEEVVSA